MVTSKRPLSPSGDDAYANLPLHNSPSANSYIVNKKRRISSASSKSSFLGRQLAHGWERFTTFLTPRKRTPAPPVSEDGDTIDSASSTMGESEGQELQEPRNGPSGRSGSRSKAGSSHTLVNGASRPRHLDDMLLPAREDRPRRDKKQANGPEDPSLDETASVIIDGIFAAVDPIGEIFAKLKPRLPPPTAKNPENATASSSARPSRSPPHADALANGTVKGKGKARATSLDTDGDATPTQLGSRSRPLDLTSPSLPPRRHGDAPPDLLYRAASDPQPISVSHDPPPSLPPKSTSPPHPPKLHFDLDNSGYQRHYWWSGSRRSPISVASSSASTSHSRSIRKKKSRNLRDEIAAKSQAKKEKMLVQRLERDYRDAEGDHKGRLKRLTDGLVSKAHRERKEKEAAYQRLAAFEAETTVKEGMSSVSVLKGMVSKTSLGRQSVATQDPALQFRRPEPKRFDPRTTLDIAKEARKRNEEPYKSGIDDIIGRLDLEDRETEARLRQRLDPIPKRITDEQSAVVQKSLRNTSFEMINGSECVNHHSLTRLAPNTWLNDEVINFYGAMLKARAEKEGKIKLHYFNSFFYQKLETQGYVKSKLARWTKKVDIFAMDLIIFPVNVQSIHWTAGAIDFQKKRIEYYDSLGDGRDLRDDFFYNIREYLQAEHMDKKKADFDITGWTDEYNDNSPQQDNGSDCGVFSCQTLENRSRGRDLIKGEFEFTSKNMRYFRDLMIWEIATKQLLKRW